jgi:hypothetical protein
MTTPPVCCHCGHLMQFLAVMPSLQTHNAWDESWRCPEGRWSFLRTVPAPPGYRTATARGARPKKPRKKPR